MMEHLRLFFTLLWVLAVGCSLATGLATLATWGGFVEYFYASLIVLAIASLGSVITALYS